MEYITQGHSTEYITHAGRVAPSRWVATAQWDAVMGKS